ncbi:Amidohydrolase 2 [Penicillium expansum]|uniref:Amidohydrolase 2 n=1 Tax=Penicillium expansum TaxID=27334 RepID=A0A0A2KC57_PENEN|nr:Amidohydrolase 2 [Penicillium expansum]KGO61945.1 Amidohydrolase 2 [Penicillium expansum]KGO69140.1 Amidohydrolase 2 [Penicillium expansum]
MTFKGTVAVEEAVIDPATTWILSESQHILTPGDAGKAAVESHKQRLLDIDGRLASMDAEGVEYMLLSLTAPGCQGIADQKLSEETATGFNDWLAGEVSKRPSRFGGMAAVSMHDPVQAAEELKRAVQQLGFFGGLINDFQSTKTSEKQLYYDTPAYDPFWRMAEQLDVPIYLHPRYPELSDLQPNTKYGSRLHLIGAGVQFYLDLSFHIYALCASGVFDRFPRLKVVAGHLGENIPFNLWRASHWYNKPSKKATRPSLHDYSYYFHKNIFITTSGNFSTPGLKFCIEELGVERCLYSIDTPYDQVKEGQEWWRTVELKDNYKELVGRENAIRLFKLPIEI